MCFPFPGLLRHVIKHILFDLFPVNQRAHRNGVKGDVNESDINKGSIKKIVVGKMIEKSVDVQLVSIYKE